MSEQRYQYATVGITEERDVPAVLLGKRNASFSIAGDEYERTAILKLPEKMNQTEFDTWKESGGIDLIDMFFHCIHQKSVRADPPEDAGGEDDGQAELMTDGGSSMPKRSLEELKELQEVDGKIGEFISSKVGEDIEGMTDLYASEHSIPEALNDIELGDFSLKEPEFIELLTLLDLGRQQAANDPPSLGVRNRLLMQIILANPEAYARVREEMRERAEEAQREAERAANQERHRQRMTDRAADLNGEEIDIELDEEENDG